eukprot:m.121518 g.121518  ORF g.121518 m.121518 type:complete len:539 (-) comp14400_c0_seq1:106-1722(-)
MSEPQKILFGNGFEGMLAIEVAQALGHSLSTFATLFPWIPRYRASKQQRQELAAKNIIDAPIVTLVDPKDVASLLSRKTYITTEEPPKPQMTMLEDRGYALTRSFRFSDATAHVHNHPNSKQPVQTPRNFFRKYLEKPPFTFGNGSEQVDLAPIRLDFEVEDFKIRETFLWNANDKLTTPKAFAMQLCQDQELPAVAIPKIAEEIEEQLKTYTAAMNIDTKGRIAKIQLNVLVGLTSLEDKFFWSHDDTSTSPEKFAIALCSDLGLGGEFPIKVAHAIREQLLHDRQSALLEEHDNNLMELNTKADVFRLEAENEWCPILETKSLQEVEKTEKELARQARDKQKIFEDEEHILKESGTKTSGRRSGRIRKEVSYAPPTTFEQPKASRPSHAITVDYNDKKIFPRVSNLTSKTPNSNKDPYSLSANERKIFWEEDDHDVEAGPVELDTRRVESLTQMQAVRERKRSLQEQQTASVVKQVKRRSSILSERRSSIASESMESPVMDPLPNGVRVYKDNYHNRKLGRVGQVKVFNQNRNKLF